MLEFAINNETTKRANSMPFLTDNFIYKGYDVMAKSNIAKPPKKYNPIYVGQRFGRLTVTKDAELREYGSRGWHKKYYECLCDCGNTTTVYISMLNTGHIRSCGCLQRDRARRIKTKHGFRNHPLNNVYTAMKSRCYAPNTTEFEHYGGRGIKMCAEWLDSREAFYEWALANGWEKGLWFDRIDVDKDYTPDNCRFVTPGLSSRNTRTIQATNTSGYRGVSWNKKDNAWSGNIQCDNVKYYLGEFDSALEAAQAYDAKAKELDAEHPLNFPNGGI